MAVIREISTPDPSLLPALCHLLQDSVDGGASVGFVSPLPPEEAEAFWREILDELGPDLRLWIAEDEGEVVGSVQMARCTKPNGRHRAEVRKLAVLRSARGRGIASGLMVALETAAREMRLRLLYLDTHAGSAAEHLYHHLGWTRAGEIPDYATTPTGELHPTVLFFKVFD
ncbi:MAG: GNAT family N-acetyltransferase [Acidobacteria bacterium]|nr:GNAT family N-acetyltransferase [Acidobacteriota bacterium]